MTKSSRVWALVVAGALSAGSLFAQGVQTSTLTGKVVDAQGAVLPGVTVTATSPALIGTRTTVTEANGNYLLRALPAGSYTVSFNLEGLRPVEVAVDLPLGGTARADATMELASVEETIVVTGESSAPLTTSTVGANYTADEVNALPIGRNLAAIAALAPGLTTNTPNAGQVTISGAFAYDNVFLVNGVDVNDNLFGTANNLFIEDAVAEVQVLTSGVSAEYGRFSGGVINAVTKTGGNTFSGGIRADYSRPEWRDETPFEDERGIEREGDLSKFYTLTLGGPILRDRIWFFLAGRDTEATTSGTYATTGIPFDQGQENRRYEAKITGNITPNHSLQAAYTENETTDIGRPAFAFSIDPRVAVTRTLPNELKVVSYTGVFTSALLGEARWSEKIFGFRNSGGTSTNIIDSPILALGFNPAVPANSHYNAPYFDSTDPEDRNNEQIAGSLSYFFTNEAIGSHDVKFGVEEYTSTRVGGNSQTSTGYVLRVDPLVVNGRVQFDAQGRIIPNFVPGQTRVENWVPTRGAAIDIETRSLFLNDRWNLNDHFSFNVGVRYEEVKGIADNITTVDTDELVPRLAASYDVLGNGKYRFDLTYAQYAGKYSEAQFARITPVGNPSVAVYQYTGPAGSGMDFGAGFDPANYSRLLAVSVPTGNVAFDRNLKSPVTDEITLSAGMMLPKGGYAKLIYTDREVSGFVEDFNRLSDGTVTVEFAGAIIRADREVYENTDVPVREYQALQLQSRFRPLTNLTLDLGWTYQLKNDGNFEGEGTNTPGIGSVFGDYPEILVESRFNPSGRLNDYQEHKVRLSAFYNLGLGRAGDLNLGLIWRYDSPLTFSYTHTQSLAGTNLTNPGYLQPPTTGTLFYGERGAGEFNSTSVFDFSLNYSIPVWKSLAPYVKVDVFNMLNDDTLVTYNTGISADPNSPRDEFGLPTGFIRGSNFGRATASSQYNIPREYFLAVGIRF
jgi:hypothetical protein